MVHYKHSNAVNHYHTCITSISSLGLEKKKIHGHFQKIHHTVILAIWHKNHLVNMWPSKIQISLSIPDNLIRAFSICLRHPWFSTEELLKASSDLNRCTKNISGLRSPETGFLATQLISFGHRHKTLQQYYRNCVKFPATW